MKYLIMLLICTALAACGGPSMTKEEQQAHWVKNHKIIIEGVDAFIASGQINAAKAMLKDIPDADGPKMRKTRAKIKAAEALAKKQSDIFSMANYICRKMVKEAAKYPTKADFGWEQKGSYAAKVTGGSVELMNSFGAMIPHTYVCKFDPAGNITNYGLREGA